MLPSTSKIDGGNQTQNPMKPRTVKKGKIAFIYFKSKTTLKNSEMNAKKKQQLKQEVFTPKANGGQANMNLTANKFSRVKTAFLPKANSNKDFDIGEGPLDNEGGE